jgi:hypothetical protein
MVYFFKVYKKPLLFFFSQLGLTKAIQRGKSWISAPGLSAIAVEISAARLAASEKSVGAIIFFIIVNLL